jgi:DNA ligase-1
MPATQSNLDGFFGVKKSNAVKKQTTLTGFVTKTKIKQDKENVLQDEDSDEKNVLQDSDEDEEPPKKVAAQNQPVKRESPVSSSEPSVKNKRRRAIVDDEDDEDEVTPMEVVKEEETAEKNEEKKQDSTESSEETLKTMAPVTKSKETPPTKKEEVKKVKEIVKEDDVKKEDDQEEDLKDEMTVVKKEEANDEESTAVQEEESEEETTSVETAPTTPHEKLVQNADRLAKAMKFRSNKELLKTAGIPHAPIPYATLVNVFEQIDKITGRLEIQGILTSLFRQVLLTTPQDLYPVVYLASNSVAPAFECVELGIGDSILIKAIGEAYGTNPCKSNKMKCCVCSLLGDMYPITHTAFDILLFLLFVITAMVKQKYKAEGDLGTVAQTFKSKQRTLMFGAKPKPLLVTEVLQVFRDIANISGSRSQTLKSDKIKKLLVKVQESTETKFIIRGLQGKLRIGLAQSTVLISLAHALALTIPETMDLVKQWEGKDSESAKNFQDTSLAPEKRLEAATSIVRKVYSEVPSYDVLLDAALMVPLKHLTKACRFQPGLPVCPMLAKPTKSIQEVLKRLNGLAFTCEYKYDGERAQIHMSADGTTKVFSRNLLETTGKFPEVPQYIQQAAVTDKVQSFVLDAEVVAFNPKTGLLVPFQVLSTRKKTQDTSEVAKVQIIVQAFDLMYLNGKSLLDQSLKERRKQMMEHFLPVEGKFQYAVSLDFVEDGDTTALEIFLDNAVKGQCEGLMVKTMDDVYEPSRRSLNWLKLKKDYLDGLGDSFDLVPLGAYYGKGKRTGVYGAYLLGCYDEDAEEFQSVCKIGTGFSDEDLKTLSDNLNKHKIDVKSSQYNVADGLACDVWFDAVHVWEIKAADLSKSSLHRGATGKVGEAGRGIGLRFPRFERLRDDKKPEQATTSEQVLEMYYQQDAVNGQEDGGDDDEDGI